MCKWAQLRLGGRTVTAGAGEIKVSTSTVAALVSKMALTGHRNATADMVLLVFHVYRRGGWHQSFTLKIFFSCSLGGGGGGRYFSVLCGRGHPETTQVPK